MSSTVRLFLLLAIALLTFPSDLASQNPCDGDPYWPGCYWGVAVYAPADTIGVPVDGFSTHWQGFTLLNEGTNSDTYDLYCSSTGNVVCSSSYVGAQSLYGGLSTPVSVQYSITAAGTGTLTLTAIGRSVGTTSSSSPTLVDPPIRIATSAHNGHNWRSDLCTNECFHSSIQYSTPAYWTLDTPRSVTLRYSSGTTLGLHTVQVHARDLDLPGNSEPASKVSVRLQRPDNSWVTFTNNSTEIFFQGGWTDGAFRRLAVQFSDTSLATGAYNYTLVIRGYWGANIREWSEKVRVLVLNQRASPYGAGWSLAGVHRLKVGPGDSLTTWDGVGDIQFWRRSSCNSTGCSYTAPFGEFDQLALTNFASRVDTVVAYTRTLVDGTQLKLDDLGRIRYVDDVFGNRVRYAWLDQERLDSIIDPIGKAIVFTYNGSNKLATIRDVPGNRTTTFTINAQNHLTDIQDPAGGYPFKLATYDSRHRVLSRRDRRGSEWKYSYDFAGRLAADSTPPVTADGSLQRLVTRYKSPETLVLVDTASGTGTSAQPASRSTDTTLIASITPPIGATRKIRVDYYGALTEVYAPLHEFARYTRNVHGQVTQSLDSLGSTTNTWNGPRLTATSSSGGSTVYFDWNTTTNRLTRKYGYSAPETRYFYNVAGVRLDSMRVGTDTPAVRYTYDSRGRVLTTTDAKGHASYSYYSASGNQNTDSIKAQSR
ncbi:MAG TPA: hypothetical protein VFO67_08880, partial [Gemmatimonadales bacterium]|nr:hypothetical protein [Gemmatimonadales bacterium]